MNPDPVQVVVVDDAKDCVDTMAELLHSWGCSVRTAATAEAALSLIEDQRPHCVLIDVVMPGIGVTNCAGDFVTDTVTTSC